MGTVDDITRLLIAYRKYIGPLLFVAVIIVAIAKGWIDVPIFNQMVDAAVRIIHELNPFGGTPA